MSVPSSELDPPPPPLPQATVYPPWTKGGGNILYSPAGEGVGESQFRRLEKKPSTLSTLCCRRKRNTFFYFFLFFGRLEWVGHSFSYVAHFMIFEGCLDSNPEYCRSMLARYRLSHPSQKENIMSTFLAPSPIYLLSFPTAGYSVTQREERLRERRDRCCDIWMWDGVQDGKKYEARASCNLFLLPQAVSPNEYTHYTV